MFREKDFSAAINKYEEALSQAAEIETSSAELTKLNVSILQNMSVCTNNT